MWLTVAAPRHRQPDRSGYEAPASAFPPSHAVNVPGISVTSARWSTTSSRRRRRGRRSRRASGPTRPSTASCAPGRATSTRSAGRRSACAPIATSRRSSASTSSEELRAAASIAVEHAGMNPLAIGQIVARNIVPLVGILAFGWSAERAPALLRRHVAGDGRDLRGTRVVASRGVERATASAARINGEAGTIAVAVFLCAFIAVPLGLPLVFVGAMSDGRLLGDVGRQRAARRRRMAGRRRDLVLLGALAGTAPPRVPTSSSSSDGSRS